LAQLQTDVKGNDPARALVAVHRLSEFGPSGANALVAILANEDLAFEIQLSALKSLAHMGPTAVPPLAGQLKSTEVFRRGPLLQALGLLGADAGSASPLLCELFQNPETDPDERGHLAWVLGSIGPAAGDSRNMLLIAAENSEDALSRRVTYVTASGQMGPLTSEQQLQITNLLVNEDNETELRAAAAAVLAGQSVRPPVLLPSLIELCGTDADWDTLADIAESIEKLGPDAAEAVPVLTSLLEHEGSDVRLAAISACRSIGESAGSAVPALVRRVQVEEDPTVIASAARAIAAIDLLAVDQILPGLAGDEETRDRTLLALAAIGPAAQAAVPALTELLADPARAESRPAALQALLAVGPGAQTSAQVVRAIFTDLNEPGSTRVTALELLAAFQDLKLEELRQATRDDSRELRITAWRILWELTREATAISALIRELADPESTELAAEALVAVGMPALAALHQTIADPQADRELRGNACRVAARLAGDSRKILVWALLQPEQELSQAAHEALVEVGPHAVPSVLAAIEELEKPTPGRDPEDVGATRYRLLRVLEDLTGPQGGPGNIGARMAESSDGGYGNSMMSDSFPDSAPAAAAPMAPRDSVFPMAPTAPMPEEAVQPRAAPQIQPRTGTKAGGAASDDFSPVTAALPAEQVTARPKWVDVFYGTNRRPETQRDPSVEHKAWSRFFPALLAGVATMAICAVGLIRSRSRWMAAAALCGMAGTLWLAAPPSSTSDDARRSRFRSGPEYGNEDSERVALGMCTVSIPPDHKQGELESPSIFRLEFEEDPQKHVVLHTVVPYGEEQFHTELKKRLAQNGNSILVFVHGYNVTFDDAARRTAQLACDLEFAGVPLFFSWPSQGNWYEYRRDEKQVRLAVPRLKQFLLDVARRSQASSIHLIAHSMGNRALTDALAEIAQVAEAEETRFNQVVLAAPDIDADIFRQQIAPAVVSKADRVTLYASSNDLALLASRTFNSGDLRVGDTSDGLVLFPGIETIDVSGVDTSLLGHSYYGSNPTVLTDLKGLLKSALPADQRPFLQPVVDQPMRYWIFQHPQVSQIPDAVIR
jgi:esterase/lipase superfamily enzyme